MAISKIKLPDNSVQDIHDARGVDVNGSFYFVQGSSSAAGSSTSGSYLSVKWEGTIPGVSEVYNGLKIAYRIATRTGVATAGVVLSIDNGAHYYPVVIQTNTLVTTHYPVGATFLAVFNSTQNATAYLTAGTKSTVTGCWQIMEYDSNTNTQLRSYVSTGDKEYPITARYNNTTGDSYYQEYGRYSDSVTLNPSTNTITASKFKISGGTSSQFLKADGSVDSNSYALVSSVPSAPGTLITNATTAQTASSGEAMSGSITLHKVSKTGTYSDLIGKPTIDSSPTASSSNLVSSGGVYTSLQSKPNYTHLTDEGDMPASPDSDTLYLIDDDDSGHDTYVHPATAYVVGGIKTGYTQSGKNYPVALDNNNNAYVNVPFNIVYLTSESEMPATPDSNTLYVILESQL